MIQVQVIYQNGTTFITEDFKTIKVNKFTVEECREIACTFGDVTVEIKNVIIIKWHDWNVIFVKQLHVK